VLYRDAEYARRKDCDYLQAYLQYENIKSEFPKTVYSEAATCYGIKCLLALADEENAKKAKASIKMLEDNFGKERSGSTSSRNPASPKPRSGRWRRSLGAWKSALGK
jgi:hypothetical protein